ncbi:hypothetical protein AMECASPLE_012216 [Ameca splendens]|uniref:Uncharacterized protein n=1 Tax=Ameca splendens TaxID=208324 RepID=A0ABV0ZNB6_9TELE
MRNTTQVNKLIEGENNMDAEQRFTPNNHQLTQSPFWFCKMANSIYATGISCWESHHMTGTERWKGVIHTCVNDYCHMWVKPSSVFQIRQCRQKVTPKSRVQQSLMKILITVVLLSMISRLDH